MDMGPLKNSTLLDFGSNDSFSRFLLSGLSQRTRTEGWSGEVMITTSVEAAKYEEHLVRISVRIVLAMYARCGRQRHQTLSRQNVLDGLLLPSSIDVDDVIAILGSNKQGMLTFDGAVSAVLSVLRAEQELELRLHGTVAGGSIVVVIYRSIFYLLAIFISFGIFGLDFSALLAPVLTFILGFTFVFGESIKRLWHAFLELVVVRRFRAGEWVNFEGFDEFEVTDANLFYVSGVAGDGTLASIPTWKLWECQLLNSDRSRYVRVRLYVHVPGETSSETLEKVGAALLAWCRAHRSVYDPSSFAFWEVADYSKNKFLGWSELMDLRLKTVCLQVVIPKMTQSEWQDVRAAQTSFMEQVRDAFQSFDVKSYGLEATETPVGDDLPRKKQGDKSPKGKEESPREDVEEK